MNIIHVIRRALGLHPARRVGEVNARSTAELVGMIRHDALYGRRHGDAVDSGAIRDACELRRKLTTPST